jgi:PAS domain S-box-containing protein
VKRKTNTTVSSLYYRIAVGLAFGLGGYAVNCLPIEIFPGIHLIFGSLVTLVAAMRYGPAAGGVAGLVAGLRTWALWHQPLPVSAVLYALEGVWVGRQMQVRRRGPLTTTLAYWLLIGGWLNLAGQLFITHLPLRLAMIVQARSIINGLLVGMLLELGLLIYEVVRRRSQPQRPARLSLNALLTLVIAATLSLPLLYISTDSIQHVRERLTDEMAASAMRDVASIESECRAFLEHQEHDLKFVGALFASPRHRTGDARAMSELLAGIHEEFSEFQSLFVTDASGRAIAAVPLTDSHSQSLIGRNLVEHRFASGLFVANAIVYSDVYQERDLAPGPALAIAQPLRDAGGALVGFAIGCVNLDRFHAVVTRYQVEGNKVLITDAAGRLISDSARQPGDYAEVESLAARQEFQLASGAASGVFDISDAAMNTTQAARLSFDQAAIVQFTTVPMTGWKIWERQSLAPLKAKLDGLYFNYLLTLLLALLLGLGFSKAVARWLTRPMVQLQRSALHMNAGNFAARLPAQQFITTEYDHLFRGFATMAERLESSWNRQQELLCEASLAKRELEATFDAMTDAVVITDAEDRIVRTNRAYCRLRNLEPEETVGRVLTDIAHADGDWRLCEVCMVRRTGGHAVIFTTADRNDVGRDLEFRIDPIINDAGERVGAVQVLRDLTEKRLAEAEAKRASALLQNLVESAYDAVYATDLEGRFLWANKRAADLFGFTGEALVSESFLQCLHEDDVERGRAGFERATRGEASQYEARCLTPEGQMRVVLVAKSPVYAENQVVAVLGIMRDVTDERREVEQLMRDDKLRALGQLASGVAHNFNNSLTAVLGYTQMVMTRVSDSKVARHLKTIETAALDAAKMVQRIQNFARQRQDDMAMPCDVKQMIRDALDLTRSRWRDDAHAAGRQYDIVFRPLEAMLVKCDQSAMREVFVNIIINALDAMPQGGRLTITTAVDNKWVVIKFTDSGCGMTEEVRRRIFEPFFSTKGAKGYGMGLSVSYGIIERHGGDILVTSDANRGSTFTVKLKLSSAEEDAPDELPLEHLPGEATVLIVDDEAPIRALLADILRARGHRVLVAEDGLAGLRAIEGMRFDMVITDLSMPGADGWRVAAEARRRWPDAKVVIITGYGGYADMAVPGGDVSLIDALISKPFNIGEIDSTISRLLLDAQDAG